MGWVVIINVERRGNDRWLYNYLLVGTEVVDIFSLDFTGMEIASIIEHANLPMVVDSFEFCARNLLPHYRSSPVLAPGRDFINMNGLLLPLASDGEKADKLKGCVQLQ